MGFLPIVFILILTISFHYLILLLTHIHSYAEHAFDPFAVGGEAFRVVVAGIAAVHAFVVIVHFLQTSINKRHQYPIFAGGRDMEKDILGKDQEDSLVESG